MRTAFRANMSRPEAIQVDVGCGKVSSTSDEVSFLISDMIGTLMRSTDVFDTFVDSASLFSTSEAAESPLQRQSSKLLVLTPNAFVEQHPFDWVVVACS